MTKRHPNSMRITRPYKTEEEFIHGDGLAIGRLKMIIIGAPSKPPGITVRFEIVLEDGSVVFRGEGRVVAHRMHSNGRHGLEVQFTRLDSHSKNLVKRVLELRKQGKLVPPRKKQPRTALDQASRPEAKSSASKASDAQKEKASAPASSAHRQSPRTKKSDDPERLAPKALKDLPNPASQGSPSKKTQVERPVALREQSGSVATDEDVEETVPTTVSSETTSSPSTDTIDEHDKRTEEQASTDDGSVHRTDDESPKKAPLTGSEAETAPFREGSPSPAPGAETTEEAETRGHDSSPASDDLEAQDSATKQSEKTLTPASEEAEAVTIEPSATTDETDEVGERNGDETSSSEARSEGQVLADEEATWSRDDQPSTLVASLDALRGRTLDFQTPEKRDELLDRLRERLQG